MCPACLRRGGGMSDWDSRDTFFLSPLVLRALVTRASFGGFAGWRFA